MGTKKITKKVSSFRCECPDERDGSLGGSSHATAKCHRRTTRCFRQCDGIIRFLCSDCKMPGDQEILPDESDLGGLKLGTKKPVKKSREWVAGTIVGRKAAYREIKELIENDEGHVFGYCRDGNIDPQSLVDYIIKMLVQYKDGV